MKIAPGLAFLVLGSLLACSKPADRVQVENMRCEYHPGPLGLDVRQPRLSWMLRSKLRGVQQSGYRILVASSRPALDQGQGDLWDSGRIASDRSHLIPYEGSPVSSRQRVFYKVMVWDQDGRPSAWSEPASWEMALLKASDWQAAWIGAPDADAATEPAAPLFRKTFIVAKSVRQARLYISGLGYYEAYLNSAKISDHVLSPNQSNYDRRKLEQWPEGRIGNMSTTVYYEIHDVTALVRSGENALGVILGNGWYRQQDRLTDTPLWHDTPRLLAQLEIIHSDGQRQVIPSDASWKTGPSPILHNGLHTGEVYDARLEKNGWDEPGFDDATWKTAVAVRPPTGKLRSQIYPADRVIRTMPAQSMTQIEPGVVQYDLGQMISGWARIKLQGPGGTAVKLRFIEEMGPSYGQTDTYILSGKGAEIWEPRFTWHAFRYVQVLDAPAPLRLDDLHGRVVNTDVDSAGTFSCSNPLINKIIENYRWTQLGNMHGGVPSDCPHRERRGYTGDGQIAARAAIYNFDMALFYRKWLRDIGNAQNSATGYVPNTAPYQDGGGGTAWGSAYVLLPWYLYLYYGDTEILHEHYEGMQKWVQYLLRERDARGLLHNQGLGEWVPPDICEIPPDYVNTCYLVLNLDTMNRIATALGKTGDAVRYAAAAQASRRAINGFFLNSDSASYSLGRQGADAFALGLDIAPDRLVQPILAHMIDRILDVQQGHFDTGILATPLVLDVLTRYGRPELAYTLMNQRDFPGYGYMIEKGATTIWETWQGDQSHSHPMFGSVCQWFFEALAGIAPDADNPGFRHILLQPQPIASLDYVQAEYRSPAGLIGSHWHFDRDDFVWDIQLPANTSATVQVPADSAVQVTEGGQPAGKSPGIRFLEMRDDRAVFHIGSGSYHFRSTAVRRMLRSPLLPAPTISPGDTLVEMPQRAQVHLSSESAGTQIRYTLDGTEPGPDAPLYSGPFSVQRTTVIKARAFTEDGEPGFVRTRLIQFVDPQRNGLHYRSYEGQWEKLPDFSGLKARKTGRVYGFRLDDVVGRDDLFALQFEGYLQIDRPGDYTFYLLSNDGSRLYLDGQLVVDHDGLHGAVEKSASIHLAQGMHAIGVEYFQAGGGMYLQVSYAGPDLSKRELPADVLFVGK